MIKISTKCKAKPIVDYLEHDQTLRAYAYTIEMYTGEYTTKYKISPRVAMSTCDTMKSMLLNFVAGKVTLPQRAKMFN